MARLIFDIAGLEKKVRVKSLRQRKKGTLTTKKIVRNHDIDHAIEQEKKHRTRKKASLMSCYFPL